MGSSDRHARPAAAGSTAAARACGSGSFGSTAMPAYMLAAEAGGETAIRMGRAEQRRRTGGRAGGNGKRCRRPPLVGSAEHRAWPPPIGSATSQMQCKWSRAARAALPLACARSPSRAANASLAAMAIALSHDAHCSAQKATPQWSEHGSLAQAQALDFCSSPGTVRRWGTGADEEWQPPPKSDVHVPMALQHAAAAATSAAPLPSTRHDRAICI